MSVRGSDTRSMSSRRTGSQMGGASVYSQARNIQRKNNLREEMISKKISEIFKEKDSRMIRIIDQTIFDDKLKVYKAKRADYESELQELEKERNKILKNRKKNKKERNKALRQNTKTQLLIFVRALQATVVHYKQFYYENDYYRMRKLYDISVLHEQQSDRQKDQIAQLLDFFNSPFKEDRKFVIKYVNTLTRDNISNAGQHIETLFFDKIFSLLLRYDKDDMNKLMIFDILCNLINHEQHRAKLANQGYLAKIYQSMRIGEIDDKTLTKLSWLTTLICYHNDMLEQIVQLRLMAFIIRLVDSKFNATIRSNAVLGISLLTYHETLFDELLQNGVIDLVMELSMDRTCDLSVKMNSTLALVHFALSKKSIKLLIDRNIMEIFTGLNQIDNGEIQTNISWIFLALCNNGITGRQMLENGITRDMFLASCNPSFHQIRHLVIAGFAELGRQTEFKSITQKRLAGTLQRIKERAIVGVHETFKKAALHTIDVLLKFSISNTGNFKITAFRALKDYILLNHNCLTENLSDIICAFVNGSMSDSEFVKLECANAISFLITHHLVFTEAEIDLRANFQTNLQLWEFNAYKNYLLDALMLLTGSDSREVCSRAFSTLSTLSTYASQMKHVMQQIQQDIKLPDGMQSRQYNNFVKERLAKSQDAFQQKFRTDRIEQDYAGLFCLLRLAQDPTERTIEEACIYMHAFFYPEHHKDLFEADVVFKEERLSEADEKGDERRELTKEDKAKICVNLYADECDTRDILLDSLNEKFFSFVFKALLQSKNQRIIYLLLDVVNFYVKHDTAYQKEILEPSIIVWMLKILQKHQRDQELCLFAAKTILRVVSNHQIEFDYQEITIIKRFNLALENIGADPNAIVVGSDTDENWNEITCHEAKENNTETSDSETNRTSQELIVIEPLQEAQNVVRGQLLSLLQNQSKKIDFEGGSEKLQIFSPGLSFEQNQARLSDAFENSQKDQEELIKMGLYRPTIPSKSDEEPDEQNIESFANPIKTETQTDPSHLEKLGIDQSFDVKTIQSEIQKAQDDDMLLNGANQDSEIEHTLITESNEQRKIPVTNRVVPINVKPLGGHKREAYERRNTIFNFNKISTHSIVTASKYEDENFELRDTLIKSFLLVFTNEKSQHLLLNQDIIDIAFSCLEYTRNISLEARINLSRLISIIFKFPQVQDFLHGTRVVRGIVDLLDQNESKDIVRNTVKACTYISMNFDFINSDQSLAVLTALTPLLDTLTPTNAMTSTTATMQERDNCVQAITNLLKGKSQNCLQFIKFNGPKKLMEILLQADCSLENVEFCISSLNSLSTQKKLFTMMMQSKECQQLLPACIKKCLELSDKWHESTKEIYLYKVIFGKLTLTEEGKQKLESEMKQKRQNDIQRIMNMKFNDINELKNIEFLESQRDVSVKMATKCKIRNYCLFTAASCLRNGFATQFFLADCNLMSCIFNDLRKDHLNDYIYLALIKVLESSRKNKDLIMHIFINYAESIFEILKSTPIVEKKLTLLKLTIFLSLQVPFELCEHKPDVLKLIFDFVRKEENTEITESIIWLVGSLLKLTDSEELLQSLISLFLDCQIIKIVLDTLEKQTNKVIVLQSLQALATLASYPQFKAELVIKHGDALFTRLAHVINSVLISATERQRLQIESTLIEIFACLTQSESPLDPTTVQAKRRVAQQGFLENFLVRIASLPYNFQEELLEPFDDKSMLEHTEESIIDLRSGITSEKLLQQLDVMESQHDQPDINSLIENTFRLASNVTDLHETHSKLVLGASRLIDLVYGLFQQLLSVCGTRQIKLHEMSLSNLRTVKHASQIIVNLCSNQVQFGVNPAEMQEQCLKNHVAMLMVKVIKQVQDYDLHANVFKMHTALVVSNNPAIAKKAVEHGCLEEVILAADQSHYFKVRRLCSQVMAKVDPSLLEFNERLKKKRNKY